MVKYRPHRSHLDEAMTGAKNFNTLDEMYRYITTYWNNLGFGELLSEEDLSITESLGDDERVAWKDYRYVLTKRMGDEIYNNPQCIAMCSIEE